MEIKTQRIQFIDGIKGIYAIAPDVLIKPELLNWIKEKKFNDFTGQIFQMHRHTRKRNKLYSFDHPIINTDVILKVSIIDRQYKFSRRLNLHISTLFKDYNFCAFKGAFLLRNIGIKCAKPIAYWTESNFFLQNKSYYLYEKIHTNHSLHSLANELSKSETNDKNSIFELLANKITSITRNIHNAGFRQGDPHPGNFLIKLPDINIKYLTMEDINKAEIFIIDLDKFSIAKPLGKTVKRFFDIRCMRRCTLGPFNQDAMLKFYLQDDYSKIWSLVLKFWIRGGFNIFKWFKSPKWGQ